MADALTSDDPQSGYDLGDEEDVYRGLNLAHCKDGQPTEGCFIMRRTDTLEKGPSHLIVRLIPIEAVTRFLPPEKYLIVRLSVGEILVHVKDKGVRIVQLPDAFFSEYADAHSVLTGYQGLTNKQIGELKHYLARLAVAALANTER